MAEQLRNWMANRGPAESIAAVVQAYPDAAKQPDMDGKLPLHYTRRLSNLGP